MRVSLAAKLALCLVLGAAPFFGLLGYLSLRLQRQHSEQLLLQSADRLSDVVKRATRYAMLRNDREAIYQLINDIGSEPGMRRIRIFNEEGRIRYSTDPQEVGTVVDKGAEACYACHAQSAPLTRLDRPDRSRIFTDARGERVLGLILPIENQPSCSNASCHAHTPERRILGVLDTDLSLASVDAQFGEQQKRLLWFTILAAVLISLVSAAFIWVVVHRPVKELTAGTRRVAGGDLGHRLPVRSRDELGVLASSFNKMTADLEKARAEITAWAQTLEERVERKTRELERAHTSLVASEKMASLGKLAATVAHEVNNPLFGILTYARLILKDLQRGNVSPEARAGMIEQLRIVERESRRCGDLVRNLLMFARQAPSHHQPQEFNTLVERAVVLVRHQAEINGIELETALSPALPAVNCDGGQVQQVLLGLLVNAIDAMPQGGRLRVATEYDEGSGSVRVTVRDSGTGIAPDVLPHIFDPFFTTKEDQQRTGLGLAVAKSIVEQHGGSIEARSAAGEGAEFVVALPVEGPQAGERSESK